MPAVLLLSLASGMGLLAFDVAIGPRLSLTADAPEGMCELGQTVTFTAQAVNASADELEALVPGGFEAHSFFFICKLTSRAETFGVMPCWSLLSS